MENLIGKVIAFGEGKVMAVCIILTIIGVIAVLHKLIKLGISVMILGCLVAIMIQGMNNLKSEYNLELDDKHISVVLNDKEYSLDFNITDKIEVYEDGDTSIIRVYSKDKMMGEVSIPSSICKIAKPILEKKHIDIVDINKK